jgi:hypothetical protein
MEPAWTTTMPAWVDPNRLSSFATVVEGVARRMRSLRLD